MHNELLSDNKSHCQEKNVLQEEDDKEVVEKETDRGLNSRESWVATNDVLEKGGHKMLMILLLKSFYC